MTNCPMEMPCLEGAPTCAACRGRGTPDASTAIGEVSAELARARAKFPGAQNSAHEGYAVLAEEVDELWDEVKANHPDRKARMRAEAIQVAAMALRFIEDVCDGKA